MKHPLRTPVRTHLLALCSAALLFATPVARAQSEVSAVSTLSAMPVASVVVGASAAAGAVVAAPVLLSTAGTVLVVKTVESTARGTLFVLERASDGAAVSVEVVGRGAGALLVGTGALVTVSVIGAGTVLSVAGEVLAFIPNALGQALLHNERITR